MSIENPTLAHFRHFSSLFTKLPSTTVERPLQISSFLTNKANFRKSQMNVNKVLTKDYENETLGEHGKKQSQTKPNKAKFKKAKMNVNKVLTKDYENKSNWAICENKPNINPIRTQSNPILLPHAAKQTQYKPNQTQFQTKCTLCEFFLFFTFLCNLLVDNIRICVSNIRNMGDFDEKARSTEKRFPSGANSGILQKLDELLANNPELAEPVLAFIELLCEKKGIEKEFHSKVLLARPERPGWIPVLGRTAAGMVHFWDQTFLPEPKQAVTELDELVKKHIGKAIIRSVDGKVSVDLQARALVDSLKRQEVNLIQISGQEPEQIVEFVQCEEIHKLFPDSFALQIDGDSMSPRINDGDIVILSPSVPAAQGQIGIARIANQIGVTCKLIRTTEQGVHLIPINERYETKVVRKKDLLWALAVLCHISI